MKYDRNTVWQTMNGNKAKIRHMDLGHVWNCVDYTKRIGRVVMEVLFIEEISVRHSNILWTLNKLGLLADSIPPTRKSNETNTSV